MTRFWSKSSILELGSGCGAVGMYAALRGQKGGGDIGKPVCLMCPPCPRVDPGGNVLKTNKIDRFFGTFKLLKKKLVFQHTKHPFSSSRSATCWCCQMLRRPYLCWNEMLWPITSIAAVLPVPCRAPKMFLEEFHRLWDVKKQMV